MRARPIIGRKVWFAPRQDGLGWGWRSVSWEGHLTLGLFLLALLGYPIAVGGEHVGLVSAGTIVIFIGVALLKGTTPGGRKRAEEFERLQS
jgi:hypothetical protein